LAGPTPGQKFGDWVHEAFPDGKADGRVVSSWARQKHVPLAEVEGIDDSTPSATRTPEVETEHSAETNHGNSGHGGGTSGHGGGNSGHGHN
jgi:hypothetical protein